MNDRPKEENYYILGFTEQFWTLWHYCLNWLPVVVEGKHCGWSPSENCQYRQNLSMDRAEAEVKMAEMHGTNWITDEWQRGTGWRPYDSGTNIMIYDPNRFRFGKYRVQFNISEAQEHHGNYLMWYYGQLAVRELTPRRASRVNRINPDLVNALRENDEAHIAAVKEHLIKLGELVMFRGELMTPRQIDRIKSDEAEGKLDAGHHFENGSRVTLEVKLVKRFSFDSFYGITSICIYVDKDNRAVKYMGSSPPAITTEDGWVKVAGTVQHSEYKGQAETKLKRIAIK